MIILPLEFKQIKFEYDVDILYPIVQPEINTKVDISAEPKVGIAIDKPPLLFLKSTRCPLLYVNLYHFEFMIVAKQAAK